MKLSKTLATALLASAFALPATAATISVEITNLTHGNYFTPLLITAHSANVDYFELGAAASDEIEAMAEGGDIAPLVTLSDSQNAVNAENPAEGPLAAL